MQTEEHEHVVGVRLSSAQRAKLELLRAAGGHRSLAAAVRDFIDRAPKPRARKAAR